MPDPGTTMSLVPVVSALLGFATAVVTEHLRDARTKKREREARTDARRIQIAERRIGFQRETLLNLQEAVLEEARSAGQICVADEREYRKTGKCPPMLPEDLNEKARFNTVKTLMLTERIRDKEVRDLMETFRTYTNQVGICRSLEAERAALQNMQNALSPLHKRIGIVLRQLDDDEAA